MRPYLPLRQRALLDLDLLVPQRELVVAADELRAQDIALVDDLVVHAQNVTKIHWGKGVTYSFFMRERSASASLMMWVSFCTSDTWLEIVSSASVTLPFSSCSSSFSESLSFSTFLCSKCSFTSAWSLAVISSFSCSI